MLWKAGCATILAGIALTVGSCFLFGTAAQEAVQHRQVASVSLQPGADRTASATVDPESPTKLSFVANIEVRAEKVNEERERGEIYQMSAPINYEVLDATGNTIHRGGGSLSGSSIIPEQTSPHYDGYDPVEACRHESARFDSGKGGPLSIQVDIPSQDEDGNQVQSVRLEVFDQLGENAGSRAFGGVLSLFGGWAILGIGVLMFLIGLLFRVKDGSRSAEA